ncbi:MAG: hypothetical protein ACYDBH_24710 [Acidobacteriaceae bacterium]
MSVDLTKSVVVKSDGPFKGSRFYPSTLRNGLFIVGIVVDKDSKRSHVASYEEYQIENIPEIVRHKRWLNVYDSNLQTIRDHFTREEADASATESRLGQAICIIFFHDPTTGKTWAEVAPNE